MDTDPLADSEDLEIRIDGGRQVTAATVAAVDAICARAEGRSARVIVRVSGAPDGPWPGELTVALVSKWERALRRLERLPAVTIAVAGGDCGGPALDALLATDYRIATDSVRLIVPVAHGATWPGMALYRLVNQAANAAAVRRAVLFGMPLGAADAVALHLIDEVTGDVPAALATATGLAGTLAGPELAIRRQLMFDAATASFEDALGVHLAACDRALRSAGTGAA